MAYCKKCGSDAGNEKFCPECGAPMNVETNNKENGPNKIQNPNSFTVSPNSTYTNTNPQKKGQSTIGIIALVLCITGCVGIVGLVLAIIDLAKNDSEHKHTLSKVAIGFFIAYTIIFFLIGSVGSSESSNKVSNATVESTVASEESVVPEEQSVVDETNSSEDASATANVAEEQPSPNQDDNTIDMEIDGCHVKYISSEIVQNMADERCLAVYYEFTNNSDENKTFLWTVEDKAFQGGVQLESSLFHVNDYSKTGDVEIQPGTTVTICSGFVLRDDSEITLEVNEYLSFDDEKDSIKIQIQ